MAGNKSINTRTGVEGMPLICSYAHEKRLSLATWNWMTAGSGIPLFPGSRSKTTPLRVAVTKPPLFATMGLV